MKALRSSPFLPVADLLHAVIFCCWVIGAAAAGVEERQSFMNALRSSPFLPAACALQVVIFDCWLLSANAGAAANVTLNVAPNVSAAMVVRIFMRFLPLNGCRETR